MNSRHPIASRRRKLVLACAAGLPILVLAGLWAHQAQAGGSVGPDVTVIYVGGASDSCSLGAYGVSNGVRGYAVGTTSCNVGDQPVWWCNDIGDTFCNTNQHPVIAQNMYRLKDGRFEQIGMSWLKHGFLSTNSFDSACGSCAGPPHGGDQLGTGCTDTYGSSLNGSRPLGERSEVNATTGDFPYPYTSVPTSTVIDQRMQVKETDMDATNNPGARFWVEGQYVTADDAVAGNGFNNASYREVSVAAGTFNLSCISPTVREQPAIMVWPVVDPEVELLNVDVPSSPVERFHVARKVTNVGGGIWHYEYAIHNMNSDRSARSFEVKFPATATITNVGYHDVVHHSGEPYATTPWTSNVDTKNNAVSWSTDTFATDPNANALRWGTMFNFWFDATAAPTSSIQHTLGLFKAGDPDAVKFNIGNDLIFADGFESGNLSSWSASVP